MTMQKYFVDPQHVEIVGDPTNEQYVSQHLFYKAADADAEVVRLKGLLNVAYGPAARPVPRVLKRPPNHKPSYANDLTKALHERDTLRDVLALLAPDLKAMAILYAQKGDHLRSQALANICKSVGVL